MQFPKSDAVDIMIFSEGTYPYVRGGVSSWIYQLISGMPEFTFGICFIGAKEVVNGKKMEVSYEIPENLIHIETHWMFDMQEEHAPRSIKGSKEGFQAVRKLYDSFKENSAAIPQELQNIEFYLKTVTFDDFLYSKRAWDFLVEKYKENCPDVPFIDYFWTLRNIHKPIWILAEIVSNLPKTQILHAPSTGYAGFLGALASYTTNKPFLLTEHGIYTRERKIELLSADWIQYNKPELLQEPEEYNYIKRMWVNFFDKIGLFCYGRANHIYSLFAGARQIQIEYGADPKRCQVIPNGIDVEKFAQTLEYREETPKPIITLIGRVVPIKDIKTFIRAIKIATIHNPDIEGWIVGPVNEDPEYVNECQQLAISLGLNTKMQYFNGNFSQIPHDELEKSSEKIKFFGHSDITKILPKTAIQTLSSISEGMPLVILEGFAAGVPCVATDVGSCKDLIYGGIDEQDIALGKAGAVTGIANPNEMADRYLELLDFTNDKWKKAQNVALQRVNRYYTEELFLFNYKTIYKYTLGLSWDEEYNKLYNKGNEA
jgi:glycosyltransferase involved in cell wall biosynthesis